MMKKLMVVMVFVSLVVCAEIANAEIAACTATSSYAVTVYTVADTTSTIINGDVTVTFSTGLSGCEAGVWMRPTDPGYNGVLSLLTAARIANKSVTFNVDTTKLWSGTTAHLCLVYAATMNP